MLGQEHYAQPALVSAPRGGDGGVDTVWGVCKEAVQVIPISAMGLCLQLLKTGFLLLQISHLWSRLYCQPRCRAYVGGEVSTYSEASPQ